MFLEPSLTEEASEYFNRKRQKQALQQSEAEKKYLWRTAEQFQNE